MTQAQAQANSGIVRRFFGAIEAGDIDTIEALQAPDCTWWVLGSGEMSREAFTDAVKSMLLSASSRSIEIIGMVAQDDRVSAEIRSELRFGERVYTNDYHDLFTLRDGRIVHGREYLDTQKVAAFFSAQGAET